MLDPTDQNGVAPNLRCCYDASLSSDGNMVEYYKMPEINPKQTLKSGLYGEQSTYAPVTKTYFVIFSNGIVSSGKKGRPGLHRKSKGKSARWGISI